MKSSFFFAFFFTFP
ncbi:hypothetical protein [Mixta hanseatica]